MLTAFMMNLKLQDSLFSTGESPYRTHPGQAAPDSGGEDLVADGVAGDTPHSTRRTRHWRATARRFPSPPNRIVELCLRHQPHAWATAMLGVGVVALLVLA
jgi:hypothetical protein